MTGDIRPVVTAVERAEREHHRRSMRVGDPCSCGYDGPLWQSEHARTEVAKAAMDAARPIILREVVTDDWLSLHTEGPDREGTAKWPERDRDIYTLAIEEAMQAIAARAAEAERGGGS